MSIRSLLKATALFSLLILLLFGCNKNEASIDASSVDGAASHLVTFIELGSVNCIPCKMMQPVMKELESNYPNDLRVLFYDVWTDEESHYAREYDIRVIPTQVFLDENGDEFYRHEGFFPYEQIVEVLSRKGVRR